MSEEWVEGMPPPKRKTKEEIEQLKQERLEKKLEKKRRKGFEIPKYGKKGMKREQQFEDEWNTFGKNEEKKYNVKGRLDFSDVEEEDEPEEEKPRISLPRRRKRRPRGQRQEFKKEAQRTPNSGATWHSKGDVKLSHALVEVKERGTVNGRGEKTISIPKEWLEKQEEEAFEERRPYWYLAFAYKGDDDIFIIKPYDHELEIVHEQEQLEEKYRQLQKDYEKLKEQYDELKKEEN